MKVRTLKPVAIGPLLALAVWITSCSEAGFNSSGSSKLHRGNAGNDPSNSQFGDVNGQINNQGDKNSKILVGDGEMVFDATTKASLEALPKFAMLSNHFECGFCHISIKGSIVSTSSVAPARNDSVGTVFGDWLVNGKYQLTNSGAKITVSGDLKEDYSGPEIPDGFPQINFGVALTKASGKLVGSSDAGEQVTVNKSIADNLVIIGTEAKPMEISGDVFIDGDLVITGPFKGIGTIYASGNIFIPFDLKATRSPFPYADDADTAKTQGMTAVRRGDLDGLALATPKTVYIGNVSSGVIGHASAPINTRADVSAREKWYPAAKFNLLYGKANNCQTGLANMHTSVNVVDAFIFAARSIEGFAKLSGFSIRGGIATNYFNVLNAGRDCVNSKLINPVTQRQMNSSYIEYDWRLATGMYRILERLGDAMK